MSGHHGWVELPLGEAAQGSDPGAGSAWREIEAHEVQKCHVAFKH